MICAKDRLRFAFVWAECFGTRCSDPTRFGYIRSFRRSPALLPAKEQSDGRQRDSRDTLPEDRASAYDGCTQQERALIDPAHCNGATFSSASVRSSTCLEAALARWPSSVSHRAEADLFDTGLYTIRTRGEIQIDISTSEQIVTSSLPTIPR